MRHKSTGVMSVWAWTALFLLGALCTVSPGLAADAESEASSGDEGQARAHVQQYMTGQSVFVENAGQWPDASILFALDGMGANVGITERGPRFQLFRRVAEAEAAEGEGIAPAADEEHKTPPAVVEMHEFGLVFDGASLVTPAGRGRSERTFNYLLGDSAYHREGVPAFDSVWYEELYPGVSLEVTGRRTGLKYNFHVAPGADWHAIRLEYEGIEGLSLAESGNLEIRLAEGWQPLTDGAPYVYQEVNGAKRAVPARFVLLDSHTYGFEVTGAYDDTLPLVIDPEVVWSTYLGGSENDTAADIALDGSANCYITGHTASTGWISGGWDTTKGSGYDGYVVKLDPDGAHLWSTYLGGASEDRGYGIAVDSAGNCYAAGKTRSAGWVSGGWDVVYDGELDAYAVKLSPDGAHLWSTYLGGGRSESAYGIATDDAGHLYVAGETQSPGWVSGGWLTAFQSPNLYGYDGFVAKFGYDGAHVWSTYVGGASDDGAKHVAVDSAGNIFVTGTTRSVGWASGGWIPSLGGFSDGYIIKLAPDSVPEWSSYLGGTGLDYGHKVKVDGAGNCYAIGTTESPGWVSGGWRADFNYEGDGYAVKFDSTGTHLWSTYIGGIVDDTCTGISVDAAGNVYLAGETESETWVSGGWDAGLSGSQDGYVVKLDSTGSHLWSSYVGGNATEGLADLELDPSGDAYVCGNTFSGGWASGGYDTAYGSNGDGYVLKLTEPAPQAGSLQVLFDPPAAAAGNQWRRVSTVPWFSSGDIETGIPAGQYVVEFCSTFGWLPPGNEVVTVPPNGTGQLTVTYSCTLAGLSWGSYLGGTGDDRGYGVDVDADGNCYATGYTNSSGWVSGGWVTTQCGGYDAYVVKLSPGGTHLWSTYMGNDLDDFGTGIAAAPDGTCLATGYTFSMGWIADGWDDTYGGPSAADGYVVRLSATGFHLWSTYLGGEEDDRGHGIAVDSEGNCYAIGETASSSWVSGGWDTTRNGGTDGYVVKLSLEGTHLWSTYLGGRYAECGTAIATAPDGGCLATGYTTSGGWTAGGWDTTKGSGDDGYVVKLGPDGAHLWSTYLGGADTDRGYSIAVDSGGNCLAAGTSNSWGWVSGGGDTSLNGGRDAYVVKLNPGGEHVWSTFLGGGLNDECYGISVDTEGSSYVTGTTATDDWTSGGWQANGLPGYGGYLAKLNLNGIHLWSSALGGGGDDVGRGVAVIPGLNGVWVTGYTSMGGWINSPELTTYGGGAYDAFIVKARDTEHTGDLQVTLAPAEAIAGGARWRRVGTTTWFNSGDIESGLPAGPCQIEFHDVVGWTRPATQTVAVPAYETGEYTATYTPLATDLAWSTYLGGTGDDYAYGVASDGDGNAYATGHTNSSGWISGGWTATQQGGTDGFIVKLDPAGAHLWSTYVGGTNDEYAYGLGVAVDATGNCYATGRTASHGWVSGGWDTTHNGGTDAYVVKLDPAGAHVWSTYLGGSNNEDGWGLALDAGGNPHVSGYTVSQGWVSGGGDVSLNGGYDGYVVKLDSAGAHVWSTYVGGTGWDEGRGIAVDGGGNTYAVGVTGSTGWTSGGFQTTPGGSNDGYIVKLSPAGSHVWSTYAGGTEFDTLLGIAVDMAGNACAAGSTSSPDWVDAGADTAHGGGSDGCLVKVSPAGAHLWSTYLGDAGSDYANGVALDGAGNIFVTGRTSSLGWVRTGWDTSYHGGYDGFVAKFSESGAYLWASYLGGAANDLSYGIAVDTAGATIWTAGTTDSEDWTEDGWQTDYGGGASDGFVVRAADTGYTGSIRIDLGPQGAIAGGAQWRFVGSNTWVDSGDTVTGLPMGSWTIEFKEIPGWFSPEPQTLLVARDETTESEAEYAPYAAEVTWSTYVGGWYDERGLGIALDADGNCYATGYTYSSGWVAGGWSTTHGDSMDGYIVKLDPEGAHLWSTYLGGPAADYGYGIAVDTDGNCYASGTSGSAGWVSGGWDTSHNGGPDAFVAKLSSEGAHIWSTFLGGAATDEGSGIATDSDGNCCVTGLTYCSGWVSGGWDTSYADRGDAFAVKLAADGTHVWSTYLGGSEGDEGLAVAADAGGEFYVAGETDSEGWISGGWLPAHQGGYDGFVVKFSSTGAYLWSTYVGGDQYDKVAGITVDLAGNAYLTGRTQSENWVSGGYVSGLHRGHDGFVVKLDSVGTHLWSTFICGWRTTSGATWGTAIATDAEGNCYAAGQTHDARWPRGGWDTTLGGDGDGYVVKISPDGAYQWASYVGGSSYDRVSGIAVEAAGTYIWTTGDTYSYDWISGGWKTSFGGGSDAFVCKALDARVAGSLHITGVPAEGLQYSGNAGGPFLPAAIPITLTNAGTSTVSWTADAMDLWLSLAPSSGSLAPGESVSIDAAVNANANTLGAGEYADGLAITDVSAGAVMGISAYLDVQAFTGVWYVDVGNTSGVENGFGWDTALTSIQDALDALDSAMPGSEIWVKGGTYAETLTLKSGIEVYGGFAGVEEALEERDVDANPTVVDATTVTPRLHVVTISNVTDSRLDGFTITGGYGFGTAWEDKLGAGITCSNVDGSNTIANCIIRGNQSENRAGGIYCADSSSPAIIDCIIAGNESAYGGAMYCVASTPSVSGCVISANTGQYGGGVNLRDASATFVNCVVSGNLASAQGGGFCCTNGASPSITNCTIAYNTSNWMVGGGIFLQDGCGATVTNSIFSHNACYAIYEEGTNADPVLTNCLFRLNLNGDCWDEGATAVTGAAAINALPGNSGNVDGARYFVQDGAGALGGTWTTDPVYDAGSNTTTLVDANAIWTPGAFRNRLIHGDIVNNKRGQALIIDNTATEIVVQGDQTANALLGDTYLLSDCRLTSGSPAIDSGTATGAPATDVAGDPRPVDIAGEGVDGSGTEYDMGAYECQDAVAPVGSIAINDGASYTNSVDAFITLNVSDSGSGLSLMRIREDGDWTRWEPHASPIPWTLSPGDDTKTIWVQCCDAAGNVRQFPDSIVLDTAPPTPVITGDDTLTNTTRILTVDFGESVDGVEAGDLTVVNGTVVNVHPASGPASSYAVTVAGSGTVTVSVTIAGGVTSDMAGNPNEPAAAPFTFPFDNDPPTATIALADPTPTEADVVRFTATFSESVGATFDAADVAIIGSLAGTAAVTGTGPVYTITVTLADAAANGEVGITIGAGVSDVAGNPYAGGTSPLYTIANWPGFTEEPEDALRYTGDSHTFEVAVAAGAGAASYQWRWDDGSGKSLQDGPASPAWTLSDLTPAHSGGYWCEVTYNSAAMYTSNTAHLAVADYLQITSAPIGGNKIVGEAHTFDVSASGGHAPLTYLWSKDENPLPGATQPAYTMGSLEIADSGSYTVQVADACTSVLTVGAELDVSSGVPLAGPAGIAILIGLLGLAGIAARKK